MDKKTGGKKAGKSGFHPRARERTDESADGSFQPRARERSDESDDAETHSNGPIGTEEP